MERVLICDVKVQSNTNVIRIFYSIYNLDSFINMDSSEWNYKGIGYNDVIELIVQTFMLNIETSVMSTLELNVQYDKNDVFYNLNENNTVKIVKESKCPALISKVLNTRNIKVSNFDEFNKHPIWAMIGFRPDSDFKILNIRKKTQYRKDYSIFRCYGFNIKTENLLVSIPDSCTKEAKKIFKYIFKLNWNQDIFEILKRLEYEWTEPQSNSTFFQLRNNLIEIQKEYSNYFLDSTLQNIVEMFPVDALVTEKAKVLNFSNKVVAIFGIFEGYSKIEIEEILLSLGAIISAKISNSVEVVIFGKNYGSEVHEAINLGITILDFNDIKDTLIRNRTIIRGEPIYPSQSITEEKSVTESKTRTYEEISGVISQDKIDNVKKKYKVDLNFTESVSYLHGKINSSVILEFLEAGLDVNYTHCDVPLFARCRDFETFRIMEQFGADFTLLHKIKGISANNISPILCNNFRDYLLRNRNILSDLNNFQIIQWLNENNFSFLPIVDEKFNELTYEFEGICGALYQFDGEKPKSMETIHYILDKTNFDFSAEYSIEIAQFETKIIIKLWHLYLYRYLLYARNKIEMSWFFDVYRNRLDFNELSSDGSNAFSLLFNLEPYVMVNAIKVLVENNVKPSLNCFNGFSFLDLVRKNKNVYKKVRKLNQNLI